MGLSLIVAVGNQNQIGLNGKIPWMIRDDLKNFKNITLNKVVIFGRKTFESIGKPLEKRINIIITKNKNYLAHNCLIYDSLEKAIKDFNKKEIFICGGQEIYCEAIDKNYNIETLYITNVDYNGSADTFLPEIDYKNYLLTSEIFNKKNKQNEYDFIFRIFKKNIYK